MSKQPTMQEFEDALEVYEGHLLDADRGAKEAIVARPLAYAELLTIARQWHDGAHSAQGDPAPVRVPEWQPIETAPKDCWLLGLQEDGHKVSTLAWNDYDHTWVDEYGDHFSPTHWMPLPEPPKESQG